MMFTLARAVGLDSGVSHVFSSETSTNHAVSQQYDFIQVCIKVHLHYLETFRQFPLNVPVCREAQQLSTLGGASHTHYNVVYSAALASHSVLYGIL